MENKKELLHNLDNLPKLHLQIPTNVVFTVNEKVYNRKEI